MVAPAATGAGFLAAIFCCWAAISSDGSSLSSSPRRSKGLAVAITEDGRAEVLAADGGGRDIPNPRHGRS